MLIRTARNLPAQFRDAFGGIIASLLHMTEVHVRAVADLVVDGVDRALNLFQLCVDIFVFLQELMNAFLGSLVPLDDRTDLLLQIIHFARIRKILILIEQQLNRLLLLRVRFNVSVADRAFAVGQNFLQQLLRNIVRVAHIGPQMLDLAIKPGILVFHQQVEACFIEVAHLLQMLGFARA
ncbi:hypothetical protein D3C76_1027750 [compost metagenome]